MAYLAEDQAGVKVQPDKSKAVNKMVYGGPVPISRVLSKYAKEKQEAQGAYSVQGYK